MEGQNAKKGAEGAKKLSILPGLEPGISAFGGRRGIRFATRPFRCVSVNM